MSAINLAWVGTITVGNQSAKQLLQFLASQNFSDDCFDFSNEYLSSHLEVTVRCVQNSFKLLREKRLLSIKKRFDKKTGRQTSNRLLLNIPTEFKEDYHRRYSPNPKINPYKSYPQDELRSQGEGELRSSLGVNYVHGEGELRSSPISKKQPFSSNISTTCEEPKNPNNKLNNKLNRESEKSEKPLSFFEPDKQSQELASRLGLNLKEELESFENRHHGIKNQYEFERWMKNSHDYQQKKTFSNQSISNKHNEPRQTAQFWGVGHPTYDSMHRVAS